MIADALGDTMLQILIVAAAVSLIVGLVQDPKSGWMEGSAILVAVVIVVFVTTTNEYMKQKQFLKLNATAESVSVVVMRGGKELVVQSEDLVVGDIINIRAGDIPQVDGIIIRSSGIFADESAVTGESEIISKDSRTAPFILSGSKICEGNGLILVCAVGNESLLGKSRKMLEEGEDDLTPLQVKLEQLGNDISKFGLTAGLVVFTTLIVYLGVDAFNRGTWDIQSWRSLIDSFIIMVTIIVLAVPEGLPLAVTLSLAYAVGKMKQENNFVRHLHACETMGGADNICSDKTGTMTENKMTAVRVYAQELDICSTISKDCLSQLSPPVQNTLFQNICCNSTAFLSSNEQGQEVMSGSRTECALLVLGLLHGYDYRLLRTPERELMQFSFTSVTKRMTTVIGTAQNAVVLTKGAGEVVLDLCTSLLLADGKTSPLTAEDRTRLLTAMRQYSSQSLRTIAFACKDITMPSANESLDQKQAEEGMTFIGFVGIEDPVRQEVPDAVLIVQKAGIVVRMVTGDSLETAVKVAKQCHLLPEQYEVSPHDLHVMEGREFREMIGGLVTEKDEAGKIIGHSVGNLQAFKEVARSLRVLARSSPEDKFLLVTGLKQLGAVVAVTGDGTNDAPALMKSDVGLAMNICGTPLAKEAADIILIDDNFASIVTAVKWGRNIFDCIRKFLQFQLTVNFVALFMSILGAVVVKDSPLTAVQILWVNLIMDTLAALALATETPTQEQLCRQPYGRNEYIITPDMWRNILSMGVYQCVWLVVLLFYGPHLFHIESSWGHTNWTEANGKHFTIFFHIFVFLQLFNEINCRKLRSSDLNVFSGFFTNWVFHLIFFSTVTVQVLLVQFGG